LKAKCVEFETFYSDESVILTSNSEVASIFPRRPRVRRNHITKVKDPARLYEVHEWLLCKYAPTPKKALPLVDRFNGDAVAYQRCSTIDVLNDAADAGYLYLSESQQAYRATLLGAALMTWKLLPPWKQLQLLKRKRTADQILADLHAAKRDAV
jgi:hypothetical protein